jgi:pimeloyl-ACP methyl ester carboxylesterase
LIRVTSDEGVRYAVRGEGPPVVLLHGWCLSRELWTYQEAAIADACTVVTIDLRGFGRSSDLRGPYSLEQLADDVVGVLDELELESATIGGFAFGALVALTIAHRHPGRVRALFLVAVPSPAYAPYDRMPRAMRRDWPEFARRSAHAICKQPQSEATLGWLERMFVQTPLHVALEGVAILGVCDPVALARGVPHRTLVVHGADDDVVPVVVAQEIVAAMPAAELAVVEDSGHLVLVDQSEAVNTILRNFVT